MRQKVIVEMTEGRPSGCLLRMDSGEEVRLVVRAVNRRYDNDRRPSATIELHAPVEERDVSRADVYARLEQERGSAPTPLADDHSAWSDGYVRRDYRLALTLHGMYSSDDEARRAGAAAIAAVMDALGDDLRFSIIELGDVQHS